ncbi:MAG: hypothetical protein M3380_09250 [Chloroflexota bacterium]|nr:hypothetical protein [Chloroflexota bacterium]
MTQALPCLPPTAPARLARLLPSTIRALLLTLLFLTLVGLRRTCDLRGYTGAALALLSGRSRAYGYRHVERFLAQVAHAGGAELFTDALARWTAALWLPPPTDSDSPAITVYIDGHRKAVYSDQRLPRGLIGRTGKVEGCRALVLLHDAQGHPLLVTTHRGDTHLTVSLPQILARYEQTVGRRLVTQIIVDREGMGAEFLAGLVADGRTVVTVLRADQYHGLASFTEVGAFVPLLTDRAGMVLREVAPARFALARPDHPGERLPLYVALVRDLRCQVLTAPSDDDLPQRWDADLSWEARDWRSADWTATPAPAPPTTAKLIAIVATSPLADATTLARTYFQRWPQQENVIRDWLIPLGIDTNHGYAKREVINSEVAKRRTTLSERLERLKRWAVAAGKRCTQAGKRHQRLYAAAKARARELSNVLFKRQCELEAQGVSEGGFRREMRAAQEQTQAEMEELNQQIRQAVATSNREFAKQERYCKEQREVLRALEDLAAREPQMYELDDAKDQIMSVCKVAVANLVLWTRDQDFPAAYAHATWHRLEPFFKLRGRVKRGTEEVQVEVGRFTDRQLNRDLVVLCERVAAAKPRLPDGRRLIFTVGGSNSLSSDDHG